MIYLVVNTHLTFVSFLKSENRYVMYVMELAAAGFFFFAVNNGLNLNPLNYHNKNEFNIQ